MRDRSFQQADYRELARRQRKPDRQAVCIDERVNLAGRSTPCPSHALLLFRLDAGSVLMHADNRGVDYFNTAIWLPCDHRVEGDAWPLGSIPRDATRAFWSSIAAAAISCRTISTQVRRFCSMSATGASMPLLWVKAMLRRTFGYRSFRKHGRPETAGRADRGRPRERPPQTQVQASLRDLGLAIGYKVWVAANDRGPAYNGTMLATGCLDRLPTSLEEAGGAESIRLIDVLWIEAASSCVTDCL